MKIEIGTFQNRLRVPEKRLRSLLQRAFDGRPGEVSVAIVARQKIRAVNRQYLGRDRETDVIAFDLADPGEKNRGMIVGEIVISADRAVSEAKRRGHSAEAELELYAVHGALHLMGMDDHSAHDAEAMHRAAVRIVNDASGKATGGVRS